MLEKNIKNLVYAPSVPVDRVLSELYRKASTICLVCDKKGKLLGLLTLSDLKQKLRASFKTGLDDFPNG